MTHLAYWMFRRSRWSREVVHFDPKVGASNNFMRSGKVFEGEINSNSGQARYHLFLSFEGKSFEDISGRPGWVILVTRVRWRSWT